MRGHKSIIFILLVGCASVWSRQISGYENDDFIPEDSNDDSETTRQLHRPSFSSEQDDSQIEQEAHHSYRRRPNKKYSEESDESDPEARYAYDRQEPDGRNLRNHPHRRYLRHSSRFDRNIRRRDNYQETDDLITRLDRLDETLQDIAKSLREQNRFQHPPPPPSPPQIINTYIPYPMPPFCSCRQGTGKENSSEPTSIGNRWGTGGIEDMRQNWGYHSSPDYDYSQYRPLSFDSVSTHQTSDDLSHRPISPPKESSSKRDSSDAALSPPTTCDIAVLSCCHQKSALDMSKCLMRHGCQETVDCSRTNVKEILQNAERFYVNS